MGIRFIALLILTSILLQGAFNIVHAQRKIEWFEPEYNFSYSTHYILYNGLVTEQYMPVHFNSFYSKPVKRGLIKEIHKQTLGLNFANDSAYQYEIDEVFVYDKKGYLVKYSIDYIKNKNNNYSVDYTYSSDHLCISAQYTSVKQSKKIVYTFNRKQLLVSVKTSFDDGFCYSVRYLYNKNGFLTEGYDSRLVNKIFDISYIQINDTSALHTIIKENDTAFDVSKKKYKPKYWFSPVDSINDVKSEYKERLFVIGKEYQFSSSVNYKNYVQNLRVDFEQFTIQHKVGNKTCTYINWDKHSAINTYYIANYSLGNGIHIKRDVYGNRIGDTWVLSSRDVNNKSELKIKIDKPIKSFSDYYFEFKNYHYSYFFFK